MDFSQTCCPAPWNTSSHQGSVFFSSMPSTSSCSRNAAAMGGQSTAKSSVKNLLLIFWWEKGWKYSSKRHHRTKDSHLLNWIWSRFTKLNFPMKVESSKNLFFTSGHLTARHRLPVQQKEIQHRVMTFDQNRKNHPWIAKNSTYIIRVWLTFETPGMFSKNV